jgi:hypothetical protein
MFRYRTLSIAVLALLQTACGGGGGGGGGDTSFSAASVSGTVPGTLIEAFGDNGSYYAVESNDDGSSHHPFTLELKPGVGFHLVMVTGEGTPDEVVTPIGFRDSSGKVRTRLVLDKGEAIDLGHVPLPMGRNEAADDDRDGNGVLDGPMVLDDVGARNPLSQSDVDDDDINDWDDPDHGGYHYDDDTDDPQDHDDDGVPNVYDDDDEGPHNDDYDGDGLPNNVDANPYNDRHHDNDDLDEDCDGDGYHDDDHDHDGYHDDDEDRDGYHDDDYDHDGDHDSDHDGDGVDDDERDDDDHHSCSGSESSDPVQPSPVVDPGPGSGLDGQALFEANCTSGCHTAGSLSGRGVEQISNAINGNRGGMGSLSFLTAQEIQAIADYLVQ